MATTNTTQVAGLKELSKILEQLPKNIERNVVTGAVRAGLIVLRTEARARVAVDDGALRKSIRISVDRKAAKRGFVQAKLIAGNKDAWYSHFIEFGTASYYTGKGKSVGKPYKIKPKKGKAAKRALKYAGKFSKSVMHPGIRPRPFMRPAIDAKQNEMLDAFRSYIVTRLPDEIRKLKK